MAEAAVISALIPVVADKLSQHVWPILNFRKNFDSFSNHLRSIESILKDVKDIRSSHSGSDWLDNLEDFMGDAEYLLEEFGAADKIFVKLKFRLMMGHKMRELEERLEKIERRGLNLLPVSNISAHAPVRHADSSIERQERSCARLQESEIVGMDGDIEEITKWILNENNPPVIAVVGMGGQGKTLLLQHVFNSEAVHKRFDCQVWLAVSQKFAVTELLRDMVKQFERYERAKHLEGNDESLANGQNDKKGAEQLNDRSVGELREKIETFLEREKCLFVVDDVWDKFAVGQLGLRLKKQDKLVLTTRDEELAKAAGAGDQILSKKSLSEDYSWQLFCLHAFPDGAHDCPEELKGIARKIVNRCGGLPLAIKTIGAYLATSSVEGRPNCWEETFSRLSAVYVIRDGVMPLLKFSYDALPHHLKPCFLYCSVYPKNTEIESDCLVHAWIAQGFVSQQLQEESYDTQLQKAYDVGCSNMKELINRCLIEVSELGWNGRVKSCKMHDLLHDLAVAEQKNCSINPGGQSNSMPARDYQVLRRISVMKNEISTIKNDIQYPRLRSLLLSDNAPLTSISPSLFDNMRYLRVLDLSRTSITSLPDSIGNLKLLKYLNLSETKIQKLPKSLSGLRQLQFLDVSRTNVQRLHSGIEKQKHMLHLNLPGGFKFLNICPVGISKLINLQTLNGVNFTLRKSRSAGSLQLRDLKGLTRLQHLSISVVFESKTPIIYASDRDHVRDNVHLDEGTFGGMTKMRTLHVLSYVPSANLHLPTDMDAMEGLEIVRLMNCVVPKWIFQLRNLVELSLTGQPKCSSADFRGLEKIPHLKRLHLQRNTNHEFIEFPNEFGEAGAFPKLEELDIQYFKHLKSIPSFQEDAMPKLKCLRIRGCQLLENMPEGLMRLRNLKEVEVDVPVGNLEGFEYTKSRCWQSFKESGIKVKVEVYEDRYRGRRLRVV